MAAATTVDGPLAAALQDQRDRCNSLVAQARRTYADFDVNVLEAELRGPIALTVDACDRLASASGSRVLGAIFGPLVELVGQHRLGGGSHEALLVALPDLGRALVDDPRLVFGSLANAVTNLHRHGVPADQWLARVRAAAATADTATVLHAGQVAAWALGVSHFRESALRVASTLPNDTLGIALGTPQPVPVAETVQQLHADRWWWPTRPRPAAPTVAHRVGGFRGFGGPFLAMPRVGVRDGAIVVIADDAAWVLHADAAGATLTRTDDDGPIDTPPAAVDVPSGLQPSSVAALADITAVTVATSYHVLVVEPAR